MECNKDEAVRCIRIAEERIESKDYKGAKKMALKAERLFPDLPEAPLMLAVCNVLCFEQTMDWYGILQVIPTAGEANIKQQYRKLAFLLHPDKNKLAGAEAAFKLIREAQEVLLESAKQSDYDST